MFSVRIARLLIIASWMENVDRTFTIFVVRTERSALLKSLYSKLNTRVTVYRKLFFFLISNTMFLYIDFFIIVFNQFIPIYILGRSFIYIGVHQAVLE